MSGPCGPVLHVGMAAAVPRSAALRFTSRFFHRCLCSRIRTSRIPFPAIESRIPPVQFGHSIIAMTRQDRLAGAGTNAEHCTDNGIRPSAKPGVNSILAPLCPSLPTVADRIRGDANDNAAGPESLEGCSLLAAPWRRNIALDHGEHIRPRQRLWPPRILVAFVSIPHGCGYSVPVLRNHHRMCLARARTMATGMGQQCPESGAHDRGVGFWSLRGGLSPFGGPGSCLGWRHRHTQTALVRHSWTRRGVLGLQSVPCLLTRPSCLCCAGMGAEIRKTGVSTGVAAPAAALEGCAALPDGGFRPSRYADNLNST